MDDKALWMMAAALPVRLRTLSAILDKGAAFAEARGRAFQDLATARLAPDMYPLADQVRLTCRLAWEAIALLGGRARPEPEPIGDTLEALKGRIEETLQRIASVTEADFQGAAVRPFVLPLQGEMSVTLTGAELLCDWSLPNVYFHFATAYDILRHEGVELGKADFMAHLAPMIRHGAN